MQSQRQVLGQLGVDIPSHWDEFDEFMIVRILLALGMTRGLAERSLRATRGSDVLCVRRAELGDDDLRESIGAVKSEV